MRAILQAAEPRYEPPSPAGVSDRIIPVWHKVSKSRLQKELESARYAGLTSDGWTSLAVETYETITAHFMHDWKLKAKVLQTKMLPGSHTGELLASELDKAIVEWKLLAGKINKVSAMTTDNASNIKLDCELLEYIHNNIGCLAHTLNLAAQKGKETIHKACMKINPVNSYFRKSPLGKNVLREPQKALNYPQHDVITEVRTSWNSGFESKQRFLEMRIPIIAALSDPRLSK